MDTTDVKACRPVWTSCLSCNSVHTDLPLNPTPSVHLLLGLKCGPLPLGALTSPLHLQGTSLTSPAGCHCTSLLLHSPLPRPAPTGGHRDLTPDLTLSPPHSRPHLGHKPSFTCSIFFPSSFHILNFKESVTLHFNIIYKKTPHTNKIFFKREMTT